MRPRKFRVWIADKKQMIYPRHFEIGSQLVPEDLMLRLDGTVCWCPGNNVIAKIVNEHEVLEWTGLTDKDGKDIYEGDLIDYDSGTGIKTRGIVEYNETASFVLNTGEEILKFDEFTDIHHDADCWTVQGNIYET